MIVDTPYNIQQRHKCAGLLIRLPYQMKFQSVCCTELSWRPPGRRASQGHTFFDKAIFAQAACYGLQIERFWIFLGSAAARWEDAHLLSTQTVSPTAQHQGTEVHEVRRQERGNIGGESTVWKGPGDGQTDCRRKRRSYVTKC